MFSKVLNNTDHVLHHLLTPVHNTSQSYSLRPHAHDRELPDSPNRRVISPNSVAFGPDYVKVIEIRQYLLQRKCRPQNLVFSDVSFTVILAGVTPSESHKVRHFALASENLTNNQP